MSQETKSKAIPCLRYRDALDAIEWLCRVLGFEKHLVVEGEHGVIVHAQLSLGGGMIMLGSVTDSEYGKLIRQPDEIGGAETQSVALTVDDADEVYARVRENGGQIVREIRDEEYGGRAFLCRDPEGHLWTVGTYDPWSAASEPAKL